MRPLLCFLLITAFAINSRAQIQLQNPSMEGTPCLSFRGPDGWTICNYYLTVDTTFYAAQPPHGPYDGLTYVALEMEYAIPTYELGTISQKLSCPLRKLNTYYFSLQASSMWYMGELHMGYLEVYAGNDSCALTKLLWMSSLIDTMWTRQNISFTPDSDYQWIGFQPYDSTLPYPFTDIAVDALSPIYLVNANEAYITNSDTTLNLGECIYAQAQSAITTYDSLYWINTNTGASFANGQWNTLLCPDSSATYLIAMRDSVPDCAGYNWSYDTLRITVLDTATGINSSVQNFTSFSIYPNPAKDVVMLKYSSKVGEGLLLQVYNALGQVVYRDRVTAAQQINISTWPAGVYCFTVLQNGAAVSTMRFLKE